LILAIPPIETLTALFQNVFGLQGVMFDEQQSPANRPYTRRNSIHKPPALPVRIKKSAAPSRGGPGPLQGAYSNPQLWWWSLIFQVQTQIVIINENHPAPNIYTWIYLLLSNICI
jgi:hypothetical protein